MAGGAEPGGRDSAGRGPRTSAGPPGPRPQRCCPHLGLRAELRDEPWSWGALGGVTAWALVILGVGELIRVRRERALTSRRASEERQRRQANEERLRIARELHDTVAHHMP